MLYHEYNPKEARERAMGEEDTARHYPLVVELRSVYLHNAISKLDTYVVGLEDKVEWLEGEVRVLQKEKADRLYLDARAAETKAYGMLSQIMQYGEGAPPINKGMGLDAVLILKHLEGLVHRVTKGNDLSVDDFLEEVEQYVEACMREAKELPTGESDE